MIFAVSILRVFYGAVLLMFTVGQVQCVASKESRPVGTQEYMVWLMRKTFILIFNIG
jgi:hypothetical protein